MPRLTFYLNLYGCFDVLDVLKVGEETDPLCLLAEIFGSPHRLARLSRVVQWQRKAEMKAKGRRRTFGREKERQPANRRRSTRSRAPGDHPPIVDHRPQHHP